MLSNDEVKIFREALLSSKKPFFFFHDDPDGLASFLLLYRFLERGKGFPLKATPHLTKNFSQLPEKFNSDAVFILDIAMADQEFIDNLHLPVVWVDHHAPVKVKAATYLNPMHNGTNVATPALCWQVVTERKEDIWIATAGCVGDWCMPPFIDECKNIYPYLFSKGKSVQELLFSNPIGMLAQVFSFCLKGPTQQVNNNVKTLLKINSPEEIISQTSTNGKHIWEYYLKIKQSYDALLNRALESISSDTLFVFTYDNDKLSLTKDLANEFLYRFPDKIIVLGRRKDSELRCSIRSSKINILKALETSLVGIRGRGGGHEHACGASIKEEDFERFLENLRNSIKN